MNVRDAQHSGRMGQAAVGVVGSLAPLLGTVIMGSSKGCARARKRPREVIQRYGLMQLLRRSRS